MVKRYVTVSPGFAFGGTISAFSLAISSNDFGAAAELPASSSGSARTERSRVMAITRDVGEPESPRASVGFPDKCRREGRRDGLPRRAGRRPLPHVRT